ncbi:MULTISPECIES: 30S ribosomal protein S17 [Ectothiorhodospira]|jgi:small subunit ribosomal protein S17|uniref:Small ribosomal subunit protein uS17 n=1 Tax=Ectothiorhodospira marina TaxID=1396821 RepID=A0A1H7I5J8_9GAMM|nr:MULTISPECIES: 30S ribosomal protein S17 [Ectothiorhodospira]MCG5517111.1 30S ribosomal protein S17 [Ectothiorhodospira sp. 9100]MCG5519970.1 30S ribosomal protein S17 [Ectothiorhodospira sp. 9905]SEK57067.1 small subunit ribosomal protein S17 [Ectothiorhodospira marina]
MSEQEVKEQRAVTGRVISDKMDKTRTVLIERRVRHPLYGKYMRRSTKLHVHDEGNDSRMGDTVLVKECRPMSRTKTFRLLKVVERAPE